MHQDCDPAEFWDKAGRHEACRTENAMWINMGAYWKQLIYPGQGHCGLKYFSIILGIQPANFTGSHSAFTTICTFAYIGS